MSCPYFFVLLYMDIRFLLLDDTHIKEIIPMIQDFTLNKFSDQILLQRIEEMFTQNYECMGVYDGKVLVGITGLWYQTRHYAGKSCEADHVYTSVLSLKRHWRRIICFYRKTF